MFADALDNLDIMRASGRGLNKREFGHLQEAGFQNSQLFHKVLDLQDGLLVKSFESPYASPFMIREQSLAPGDLRKFPDQIAILGWADLS